VELGDVLDLHTFSPRDVKSLVGDYIDDCAERGFTHVRIIHGKGKGVLREIVHSVLAKHPAVASFRLGDESAGGWGATLVEVIPAAASRPRGGGENQQ
jgi:dsDNA-specific endonuclease/ATPase MutS2